MTCQSLFKNLFYKKAKSDVSGAPEAVSEESEKSGNTTEKDCEDATMEEGNSFPDFIILYLFFFWEIFPFSSFYICLILC